MNVTCGKKAGFCYGIKNAVSSTEKILNEYNKVACLGELLHNEAVLNQLKANGLEIIDTIEEGKKYHKVVLRAHGVTKDIYKKAKKMDIDIYDNTCPKVKVIHHYLEEYNKRNYSVIIIGEKEHPEVIGTMSFADDVYVIENMDDIDRLPRLNKVLCVAQTTFNSLKYQEMVETLTRKYDHIKIINTICNSTYERQKETKEIAKTVDMMVIIGGLKSSNTKKLYDISKGICKEAIWIQTDDDIKLEECKKYHSIGVMAGASTPDFLINSVVEKIRGY
ncbi:MAG: 4-hydroxy-3-methylbut-2-enyl diphosphate reductase [Clostridia bacterium]|nr:4-hydroxy-3-methylbut-2-enyl diphosphate reductase [Clostridia bacterium]